MNGKLTFLKPHYEWINQYRWVFSELWLMPNIISITRILLIIPIVLLYPLESKAAFWAMMTLLIVSYVSDFLDGFLARRLNQRSRLGLFLDPGADKIWTLVLIVMLVIYRDLNLFIASVIIQRDLVIILINYRFRYTPHLIMAPTLTGKMYMVVTGAMIVGLSAGLSQFHYLYLLIIPLAIITLSSYVQRFRITYNKYKALSKPVAKPVID